MTERSNPSTTVLWARFRFSVIGPLLSAPPRRGELKAAIRSLAEKVWTHPIDGRQVRYSAKSIERWFYKARNEREDPVGVLRRAVRKDSGRVSVGAKKRRQSTFLGNKGRRVKTGELVNSSGMEKSRREPPLAEKGRRSSRRGRSL